VGSEKDKERAGIKEEGSKIFKGKGPG